MSEKKIEHYYIYSLIIQFIVFVLYAAFLHLGFNYDIGFGVAYAYPAIAFCISLFLYLWLVYFSIKRKGIKSFLIRTIALFIPYLTIGLIMTVYFKINAMG